MFNLKILNCTFLNLFGTLFYKLVLICFQVFNISKYFQIIYYFEKNKI